IFVAIGFSSYFVGLLYAMPVTTREGVFAVYQPESAFDSKPLAPIHVLTPTTVQKNFLLIMGAVYPAIFGWGAGVASAVLTQTPGYERPAKILLLVQYSNWVLILWSMAIMFFYYGLKYTFILRANIIIAEAALRAPKAAFGISNLKSSSPARFLFIQLQITGFGGAAVTLLAGSLCMIWVLYRQQILEMENDQIPHTMAFFWTCAIAAAFFVIMLLIAIQSIRSRRRSRNEPSSASLTNSFMPSSGQKSSGQKSSVLAKGMYSSSNQHKANSLSSEAGLAQRNSAELSTLNSANSVEKGFYENHSYEFPEGQLHDHARRFENDAFTVAHNQNKMDQEQEQRLSGGSLVPTRPFTILPPGSATSKRSVDISSDEPRRGSDASSAGYGRIHHDLRTSVFGRVGRPSSPPPSVPASPSYPMKAMRSSSRSSNLRHPDQVGTHSSSSHTTSTSTSSQISQSGHKEHRFSTIPEGFAVAKSDQGGDLLYSSAIQYQPQPGHPQSQPSQSLQYQMSSKGLSPPPRTQRLPKTSPASSQDTYVSSTGSSVPSGDTFANPSLGHATQPAGAYFSDTPRVGGGVRRKSLKGLSPNDDPSWPLPQP
ncbi:hypothetical protein BGZ93_003279, partial [Podila epicladia]